MNTSTIPPIIIPAVAVACITAFAAVLPTASASAQSDSAAIAELRDINPDLAAAEICYENEDWEGAVDAYENGFNGSGATFWHLHNYAYALLQTDRYAQAERALAYIIRHDSTDALAWFNRGIARTLMDHDHAALRCFERSAYLRPQDPDAWLLVGLTALRLDNYRRAWEAFDILVQMDEEDAAYLHDSIVRAERWYNDPLREIW